MQGIEHKAVIVDGSQESVACLVDALDNGFSIMRSDASGDRVVYLFVRYAGNSPDTTGGQLELQ